MKILKRIFVILAILVVLLLGVSSVLGWIYKDDVKELALTQIHNYVKVPVTFQDVEINFFEHFPNASIAVSNVCLYYPGSKKDTLTFSEELIFACHPFSFLTDQYNISLISFEQGFFRLNKKIRWEDIFIKQVNKQESSGSLNVLIDKIQLKNIDVHYQLPQKKLISNLHVQDVLLQGNFSTEQFDLLTKGKVFIDAFSANEISYINKKQIRLNTSISVNTLNEVWQFNPSTIYYGNLPLQIEGRFLSEGDVWKCKVGATGTQWQVQEFMDDLLWLPAYKDEWVWKGNANVKASMNGQISKTQSPTIVVDVDWQKGNWTWKNHNAQLNNIQLKGSYTNKTSTGVDKIKIDHFTAENSKSSLNLQGAIARLEDPYFNLWGNNIIDLALVKPWLDSVGVKELTGMATFDFKSKGKAKNKTLHWTDFFTDQSEVKVSLQDVTSRIGNITVENGTASLLQINNETKLNSAKATINGTTFSSAGSIENWVPWVKETNSILKLNVSAETGDIHVNQWLNNSKTKENSEPFSFPSNVVASIKLKTEKLLWNQFEASKLSGLILYSNNKLSTTGFRFKHANGTIITNASLEHNKGLWHLSSNTNVKQIKVDELFRQWDNFGQKTITHQQIKGIANAQALVDTDFDANGVKLNSLYSLTEFVINQGSLTNNNALAEIGSYLKSNLLIKTFVKVDELSKNLNDLRFERLSNLIEIENGKVIIPEMEITTNALSMYAKGSHSFEQNIDYQFNFLLNDVLRRGQSKKADDGITEGGKRIFLKANGTVDNPNFGLDRVASRAYKQKVEEQQINAVSTDRFVDDDISSSTSNSTSKTPTNSSLPKTTAKTQSKADSVNRSNRLNKWLKKLEGKPEDDKKEVDWEIDFPAQD